MAKGLTARLVGGRTLIKPPLLLVLLLLLLLLLVVVVVVGKRVASARQPGWALTPTRRVGSHDNAVPVHDRLRRVSRRVHQVKKLTYNAHEDRRWFWRMSAGTREFSSPLPPITYRAPPPKRIARHVFCRYQKLKSPRFCKDIRRWRHRAICSRTVRFWKSVVRWSSRDTSIGWTALVKLLFLDEENIYFVTILFTRSRLLGFLIVTTNITLHLIRISRDRFDVFFCIFGLRQ